MGREGGGEVRKTRKLRETRKVDELFEGRGGEGGNFEESKFKPCFHFLFN